MSDKPSTPPTPPAQATPTQPPGAPTPPAPAKPPTPPPDEQLLRAAQPSPHDDGTHSLDPVTERDLWHGRASWKGIYPPAILLLLAAIVVCGVLLYYGQSKWVVTALLTALALLLVLLARHAWHVWQTSYRITTQRLFIRRGILRQTVDQTELLRVDDVRMRQTLLQRALGIGDVDISSSDRSDAKVTLVGIDEPPIVAEHIRRHTRTVQKRTLFMEQL